MQGRFCARQSAHKRLQRAQVRPKRAVSAESGRCDRGLRSVTRSWVRMQHVGVVRSNMDPNNQFCGSALG
jgi:hypothetical protein